jgi:hypothetical protein
MMNRRTAPNPSRAIPQTGDAAADLRGLTGVPLFLITVIGRSTVLLLAIVAFQVVFMRFIGNSAASGPIEVGAMQIAIFSMMFGAIVAEWGGVRTLRALPLSTRNLTLLLMATPLVLGVVGSALLSILRHTHSAGVPDLVLWAGEAIALGGFAALILAVNLSISSVARVVAMIPLAMVCVIPMAFAGRSPLGLVAAVALGIAAGVTAYRVIHRGLRHSTEFYQTRRMFGMAVGQAATR